MHSTPSKKRRLPAVLLSTALMEQQNFKDEIKDKHLYTNIQIKHQGLRPLISINGEYWLLQH